MQVLYARHHVRVFRFVLRLVRDETTAEDVISEVFFDVWRQQVVLKDDVVSVDMDVGHCPVQGALRASAPN